MSTPVINKFAVIKLYVLQLSDFFFYVKHLNLEPKNIKLQSPSIYLFHMRDNIDR